MISRPKPIGIGQQSNSERTIFARLRLLKAREGERIAELLAVLRMNAFKGCELNAKLRGWLIHALIARAFQVHLNA